MNSIELKNYWPRKFQIKTISILNFLKRAGLTSLQFALEALEWLFISPRLYRQISPQHLPEEITFPPANWR